MKNLIILISLMLSACATQMPAPTQDEPNLAEESEPPRHKRVYYFQHKLLPKWLFESEGAFFFDLQNRNAGQLLEAAESLIDIEFSNQLHIELINDSDAILFMFEKPNSPPNCYYALIQKQDEGFRYLTYESAQAFGEEFIGVVGGWNENGDHLNMGPRTYATPEEFARDVLKVEGLKIQARTSKSEL